MSRSDPARRSKRQARGERIERGLVVKGATIGCERNWKVVALTTHNTVVTERPEGHEWVGGLCARCGTVGGYRPKCRLDTAEPPSAYSGLPYLSRTERGILRKGLTANGNDRRPR